VLNWKCFTSGSGQYLPTFASDNSLHHMSAQTYAARARSHKSPLARRLFEIMEKKRSNLAISADMTDTKSLLEMADGMSTRLR
jgi:orotidine-5'-phosphate decarboxylase